jgi:hypothetical protein
MMPSEYGLKLYHGDSYSWQFKLWLDEGKTAPLDLTGVVPKAEIRFEPGGAVIVTFVTEVVLPNIIAMSLSSTQCQALEIAPHIWDLQLTYPSGSVNTILMGTVEVTADVTDSVAAGALMAQPTTIAMQQGKTLKFPRAARKKG